MGASFGYYDYMGKIIFNDDGYIDTLDEVEEEDKEETYQLTKQIGFTPIVKDKESELVHRDLTFRQDNGKNRIVGRVATRVQFEI